MKALTLADLFTPENSGETYVKIAKYREAEQQIKGLEEFAQHKPECQYWADIKAVKSNLLPNLRPDCNCGLKQALR